MPNRNFIAPRRWKKRIHHNFNKATMHADGGQLRPTATSISRLNSSSRNAPRGVSTKLLLKPCGPASACHFHFATPASVGPQRHL